MDRHAPECLAHLFDEIKKTSTSPKKAEKTRKIIKWANKFMIVKKIWEEESLGIKATTEKKLAETILPRLKKIEGLSLANVQRLLDFLRRHHNDWLTKNVDYSKSNKKKKK